MLQDRRVAALRYSMNIGVCGCPKMVSPKTGEKSTHTLVIYYQSIKYNKRIQINHLYFSVSPFFGVILPEINVW